MTQVKLTADLIEAFAGTFLSPMYDQPHPTPQFHREIWALYCSDAPSCAVAAPRNHAKSTGLTHDYGLAVGLFREQDYIIILGATEEMAIEHLGEIASELRSNEDIIREFSIKGFLTDQKTDIVVEFNDGHQLRYIARGGEQKIRGKKWRGKRPGLILGDDIEDDEQVENKDRRDKFFRWLLRAAKQALRDGGKFRMHGTILHEDSALAKVMKLSDWSTLLYKAHKGFDDFSEILWEEKFPEARLRALRQGFINAGDGPGYSQEFLNDPFDHENAYLKKEGFVEMSDEDRDRSKIYSVGVDFAISKADKANSTSFTVGGVCDENLIHVVDQHKGKWNSLEIIDKMFDIDALWHPDIWFIEDGQIWKAIEPILQREMRTRDHYISYQAIVSIKDKAVRGRAYQKRHRASGMRFDKQADWYPAYEAENLKFTGIGEAKEDDQFDSTSILVRGLDLRVPVEQEDFKSDDEHEFERESNSSRRAGQPNLPPGWRTGYN